MKEKNALVGHNFRFNSSLREGVTPHFLMSAIRGARVVAQTLQRQTQPGVSRSTISG